MPVAHQGKLLGILYLENNLVEGAFSADRVEVLGLLCAQTAISLENARVYPSSSTSRSCRTTSSWRWGRSRCQSAPGPVPSQTHQQAGELSCLGLRHAVLNEPHVQ